MRRCCVYLHTVVSGKAPIPALKECFPVAISRLGWLCCCAAPFLVRAQNSIWGAERDFLVWEIEVPESGEWRRCSQDEDEALRRLVRGGVDLIKSPTTETIESVCTHPATSSAATEKERDGESDQHSVERSTRANDEILREPQVESEMPLESSAATEKEWDGESDQQTSLSAYLLPAICSSEGDERPDTEFGCVAQDEDDDHYENTRANDEILREPQVE